MGTKFSSQAQVLKDATECMSLCLGYYSKHLAKIQKEDAKHQIKSYGGNDGSYSDRDSNSDRDISTRGDSLSEYGFPPEQSLGPPTTEALEFLVDCTEVISG